MIIDCHFHIDETMLSLEKMIEGMDENQIAKTVLIASMNETMFEAGDTLQTNLQHLFRFLILNAPQIGLKIYDGLVRDGHLHLYGHSYQIYQKPDNGSVAAVIEQYPDQFLGWAALNPMIPGSLEEIEFYLNQPGFIGVKAHPFMHEYRMQELAPAAALCEEKGVPMLIHLSSERDSYKYLPEKYPKLKLIYAHAGLPFWKGLWKYIKDKPNVFIDTSSDYLTPSIVKMAVDALGYRKLLYGCDGPYGMKEYNVYDYSAKKHWIEMLPIPDHEKEYIMGGNFFELIGNQE